MKNKYENMYIDQIVDDSSPKLFNRLSKLLCVPFPTTRDKKKELIKEIARRYEEGHDE